jgi:hypothetical protein
MVIVPIYAKVSIKRRKEYEKYKETHQSKLFPRSPRLSFDEACRII